MSRPSQPSPQNRKTKNQAPKRNRKNRNKARRLLPLILMKRPKIPAKEMTRDNKTVRMTIRVVMIKAIKKMEGRREGMTNRMVKRCWT